MAKYVRSKRRSRGGGPPRGSRRTSRYEPYGPKPTMVRIEETELNQPDEIQRMAGIEEKKAVDGRDAHLIRFSEPTPANISDTAPLTREAEGSVLRRLLNQYSQIIYKFNTSLHKRPLSRIACPPSLAGKSKLFERQFSHADQGSRFATSVITKCLEWINTPIQFPVQQLMSEYPFPEEFVAPLIDGLYKLHRRSDSKTIIEIREFSLGPNSDPWAVIKGPSGINIGAAQASLEDIEEDMQSKITSVVSAGQDIIQDTAESAFRVVLRGTAAAADIIGSIPTIIKPLIITAASSIGVGIEIRPENFAGDKYEELKAREESYNLKISLLLWCRMVLESYWEGIRRTQPSQELTDALTVLTWTIHKVKDLYMCASREVLALHPPSDRGQHEKKKSTKKKKSSKKKKAKKKVTVNKPAKKKNVTKKKKKKKKK